MASGEFDKLMQDIYLAEERASEQRRKLKEGRSF